MREEKLRYEADGLAMESRLFLPEHEGRSPGVLVFPEIFGLGEHAIGRARRLTEELGVAALACDIHGGGEVIEDVERVMGLMAPVRSDPLRVRARAEGGLRALAARNETDPARIAAIGFCFGGTMALELARSGVALAAAAGFHSGLATARPKDAAAIKARILVCIGADDPGIPPEQRAAFETEMKEGGVHWRMILFGGVVHSFTNPDAAKLGRPEFARYDAEADRISWEAMRDLFRETLGTA